jgi:hypothetical protein
MPTIDAPKRLTGVLLAGSAAALLALALLAFDPPASDAASCTVFADASTDGTTVTVKAHTCEDSYEKFAVFCQGGTIQVNHWFEAEAPYLTDSFVSCTAPVHVDVEGFGGNDTIDLSRVSPFGGFSAPAAANIVGGGSGDDTLIGSSFPDSVVGGDGSDNLLLRDGAPDTADCGARVDSAQTDRASLDAVSNCEIVDALPEPTKKCKKGKKGAKVAKKRCRKKTK